MAEDSDYVYSSNAGGQTEEAAMKIRLAKSEKAVPIEAKMKQRALDRSSIDRWMGKMNDALDGGIDNVMKAGDAFRRRTKKKETVSPAMVAALEKKLFIAIKSKFRARLAKLKKLRPQEAAALMADEPDDGLDELADLPVPKSSERKRVTLTTRDLLPYYKLDAVIQFMDIFAKVDENFSGDLDVNEWIRLFTSLNEAVPVQEARMIFMKIDKDADGFLSMRELIPVVFNKASRIQQKRIIEYCEMELMKKIETEIIPTVTATNLEFLFEAYDSESVGFIEVNVVRERVKKMNLTDPQLFFFADLISDLADDEMVNLTEFKRMFKIFTRK
jgi:Ca2+-binding EF-hand superfamily protein